MTDSDMPGKSGRGLDNSDEGMDSFALRASTLLSESTEHLDGGTLSRLSKARSVALDAVDPPQAASAWRFALVPAGLAAALVVAVTFREAPTTLPSVYDDPRQQAVVEEMELLDNMEFMAWLALQEEGSDGSSS